MSACFLIVDRKCRFLRFSQHGLNGFHHFCKGIFVIDRHFRKRFPIQNNTRLFQTGNKFAVAKPKLPHSRIDSDNPQCPEFTFPDPAVSCCITIRPDNGLLDCPQQPSASAPKPFCPLENSIFRPPSGSPPLCPHRSFPFSLN